LTAGTLSGKAASVAVTGCSHTTDTLKAGKLAVAWLSGTTNGTVISSEAEVTAKSTTFGVSIVCKTGAGTDIGTFTGVKEGEATMDISASVDCGLFSAILEGTGTVTSPAGLGVES
jgi:hypothetical protein